MTKVVLITKKARNKDSTDYGPTALKNKKLYEFRNEKVT
jgi:hypothetical protein